jgi:colanic acid biosynthesis glycosyl transferase WcaI
VNPADHIVFVEQYYYPEGWGGAQIPLDITIALAETGRAVTVYCGKDPYVAVSKDGYKDPRHAGVKIRYVPRYRLGRQKKKGLMAQVWFSTVTALMLLTHRRPTMLMVQTNPPLIVIAMSIVAIIFRRPLIIIAQDLYPEVMIAHGMMAARGPWGRIMGAVFAFAYTHAERVVSLGPRMTSRLVEKGVASERILEISNWATGDLRVVRGPENDLIPAWNLSGKFVLLYSGNLGVAHDVNTVINAISKCRAALPNLRLVILGQGSRLIEAQNLVKRLAVDDIVTFRDLVPAAILPQSLGVADLALVTLLPGFEGLVVPSKLLGHMARGIPTLYVGPDDSDVAKLIADSGGGFAVRNGEVEQLAARLVLLAKNPLALQRMGASAVAYYFDRLSRESGLLRYRGLADAISRESHS